VLTDAVMSMAFLKLLAGLLAVAIIVGTAFWLAERRANPAFAGRKMSGWGTGIWLSVVTMTTVGYGDTTPRTVSGRVIAALWMFASIVLISIFTGTVATLLTLERLGPRVAGFEDLEHARVVAVTASAAAHFLEARQVPAQNLPDPEEALQALLDGRADAFVFDRALLASSIKQHPGLPIAIVPGIARLEYYAFALRPDEPLRRQINEVIARTLDTAAWRQVRFEYFGDKSDQH
ncbi:MAG TPA: transporter substrate-binding domain-containing protein, partial [Candidatus Methylomirabilis sp.]|nr:transporter substrate-binding domain-containing protein [Candidatus Methylomirabilis sp.]